MQMCLHLLSFCHYTVQEDVPAMAPVLANPVRKDGSNALERICIEDPLTGR